MLNLERIFQQDCLLRAMTGLNHKAFESLVPSLLTQARGGRIHDKRQLEEADLVEYIPDQVAIEGDLGFQG